MFAARPTLYLALALLAAAAGFGLASLYVPAIALGLLAAGAIAWVEASARGMRPSSEPGPATLVEGERYPLRLRLDWRGPPPPSGELSHPGLERPLALGSGGPHEFLAELQLGRWGPREVEPPWLSVRDPLGLHERRLRAGVEHRVLVLPRVEPVRAPARGAGGAPVLRGGTLGPGSSGRDAPAIDSEIDGLRPWRQGTPASRIHWPSVARSGELLERRLVGGAETSPLVILDRSERADEESLAKSVRAAASLCVHLAQAGGCSLMLPGEARPLAIDRELRSWPRAHARLALTDPERPAAVQPPPSAAAVFWIVPTASGTDGHPGRRGRGGFLVAPRALEGARPAFEVAGCFGYPLAGRERG